MAITIAFFAYPSSLGEVMQAAARADPSKGRLVKETVAMMERPDPMQIPTAELSQV